MTVKEIIGNMFKKIKENMHTHSNKSTLDSLTSTKIYSYDNHLSNDNVHLKNLLYDATEPVWGYYGSLYSNPQYRSRYHMITRYNTDRGGSIVFFDDNVTGMLNLQIDGKYYQNEGLYEVIDSNTIKTSLASIKSSSMSGGGVYVRYENHGYLLFVCEVMESGGGGVSNTTSTLIPCDVLYNEMATSGTCDIIGYDNNDLKKLWSIGNSGGAGILFVYHPTANNVITLKIYQVG